MASTRVLVLGSNFAGLTAALETQYAFRGTGGGLDLTVLSKSDRFVFTPSQIWVPFGKREADDITVPLGPVMSRLGIHFVPSPATRIDRATRMVTAANGQVYPYDYLVIATGFRNDFSGVPGMDPKDGFANTITTLPEAERTHQAWLKFIRDPGDRGIIVGAAPKAGCMGAAYEEVLNMAYQLKRIRLNKRVPLTYISGEPFLGHFGINGMAGAKPAVSMFFKMTGIKPVINAAIESVSGDYLTLADGSVRPFDLAVLIPPFVGVDVVREVEGLTDAGGYVPVDENYHSALDPRIYAVGIAAQVTTPWVTAVALGVPKTGFPSEVQARIAARTIAAEVLGTPAPVGKAFKDIPAICLMDAGGPPFGGAMILGSTMFGPRKFSAIIPGPQVHLMKVLFEKYFLFKVRHGLRWQ